MYYIYHIPGVKIGCTDNLERRLEQQGFSNYKVLETHSDIYLASNRELKLQKEYGYEVDKIPYFKSVERWGSNAGKMGGKNSQKILKEKKLGWYGYSADKRRDVGKIGGEVILKKYGKEHYQKMRANSNCVQRSIEVCSKAVIRVDKLGNKKQYSSIKAASLDLNITSAAICKCLKGQSKTSKGYFWYYV